MTATCCAAWTRDVAKFSPGGTENLKRQHVTPDHLSEAGGTRRRLEWRHGTRVHTLMTV